MKKIVSFWIIIIIDNFFYMEAYGKIFVVVAVLAVILVGIFGYLFTIDRKVKKLEEEMDSKSTNKQK